MGSISTPSLGKMVSGFLSKSCVVGACQHPCQVNLAGQFALWLASKEADFLAGRFVYASWDVDELKARADEIKSSDLLKIGLIGEPAA